jgi:hypothetical protein
MIRRIILSLKKRWMGVQGKSWNVKEEMDDKEFRE